jgi:hypothetical protein
MRFGVVLLALGTIAAVLGTVAALNYSERCFVNPGPFPPCVPQYQIPLLAPLYPISAVIEGFGIIATILGTVFAFVGYSKWTVTEPSIAPSKPGN